MKSNSVLIMLASGVALAGCADVTAIEDGAVYGDVEVVQDWFTSIGLVRSGETTLLIDAGYREEKVAAALADRGVDAADVDHVLLTHGHDDHIGAQAIYTGAEIWSLADEETLLAEAGLTGVLPLKTGLATFGDVEVEVIAVPGHTPGSAVYRVGAALLMGDTALIDRDGALTTVAEKRSEDPEAAAESLVALATTLSGREDLSWVVPSHSAGGSIELLYALAE